LYVTTHTPKKWVTNKPVYQPEWQISEHITISRDEVEDYSITVEDFFNEVSKI